MNLDDIRSRPDEERRDDLSNAGEELFNLRFQSATEQIENPARIRELRRGIARINTVLRERELGIRGAEPRTKQG